MVMCITNSKTRDRSLNIRNIGMPLCSELIKALGNILASNNIGINPSNAKATFVHSTGMQIILITI